MPQRKPEVTRRTAAGIPYELPRKIAEAEWIRAAQARQAAREKRQEELPDKVAALAHFTAMSDKVYPAFAGVLGGQKPTIRVRDMTSRWGVCCMKRRQITFA